MIFHSNSRSSYREHGNFLIRVLETRNEMGVIGCKIVYARRAQPKFSGFHESQPGAPISQRKPSANG
jgi:hypothetical protein